MRTYILLAGLEGAVLQVIGRSDHYLATPHQQSALSIHTFRVSAPSPNRKRACSITQAGRQAGTALKPRRLSSPQEPFICTLGTRVTACAKHITGSVRRCRAASTEPAHKAGTAPVIGHSHCPVLLWQRLVAPGRWLASGAPSLSPAQAFPTVASQQRVCSQGELPGAAPS